MRVFLVLIMPVLIFTASIATSILDYNTVSRILFASFVIYMMLLILFIYLLSKKTLKALNKECDPEKFMLYNKKFKNFIPPSTREIHFKLNEAVGLRHLGRFDEALLCLQSINFNYLRKPIPQYLIITYYNNLADLYILKKDLNAAQENSLYCKQILDTANLNEKQRKNLQDTLYGNQYIINVLNGNTENFENFFMQKFEHPENNCDKIDSALNLAEFYLLTNQYDKVKPLLEFIINNGNKLYHVKKAQEYLDKI